MKQTLRPAVTLFVLLTALTGLAYPLLTTGIGKLLFPAQVAGSLIVQDGRTVGSELIGQQFTEPRYFWGRPSATIPSNSRCSATAFPASLP